METEPDRTVQVNVRLPLSLKEAAEKAAASDHRSLTSLVEKLLADHVRTKPTLDDWHEKSRTRLEGILAEKRPQITKFGFFTRSYSIQTRQLEQLNPALLLRILNAVRADLGNFLNNPEMVHPYSRMEYCPYFTSNSRLKMGNSTEILKSIALLDRRMVEFWRVSPTGLTSDARTYFEDSDNARRLNREPGKWFSPLFITRRLYSLIQHAYLLSEKFISAEAVQFQCEWTGLLERALRDHDDMADWLPGKISRVDTRVTTGEWPISAVRMQWPEIASVLGGPVMRLFDPTFDYTADFIRSQIRRITG